MTGWRRLLAAAILAVGVLGLAAVAALSLGTTEKETSFGPTEAVTSVEVQMESGAGRVEVVATAEGGARVRRTDRYLLVAPTVAQSVVDGVLRLRAGCPRLFAAACQVRYRVELPANVAVRVRSARGAVSVDGMTDVVDVQTGTGAIALAHTSGPLKARSATDAIEGVGLAPVSLDASTGAGHIRLSLEQASQRVDLRAGAGSIDLILPADRYRVEASARPGKADVSVMEHATSSYSVRATTKAGGIRIRPA